MRQLITATPIGKLAVTYASDLVLAVQPLISSPCATSNKEYFAREIDRQLQAYFAGDLQKFDIPFLFANGTDFQVRVWQQISNVPFGSTQTYGQIASNVNSAPRAVGNACRRNRLLLIIPCHRVVSINGPGGFMGDTDGSLVSRKQWLLNHEQAHRCAT